MKNWEKYNAFLKTGDFHVHTNYTEGLNSVFELCEQAIQNGLKLICFAEHVRKNLTYDFDSLLNEIEEARELYPKLKILSGCEAKVMDWSGNLDVSQEILDKSEIVIFGFHSFPYGAKKDFLKSLYGALKYPRVDIWGHPQTFLRNVDLTTSELQSIIRECKKRRVLIEDSLAEVYRTPPSFLNMCKELKAPVVTNSDAHDIYSLKNLATFK
jgi:histidinol phosphatase-like PHP family hydrolase